MCSGERPIGVTEGKQTHTMASCQSPPPRPPPPPKRYSPWLRLPTRWLLLGEPHEAEQGCQAFKLWRGNCRSCSSADAGEAYFWGARVGQLSRCSQLLPQPLGAAPTPALPMLHIQSSL